jgi:hypothetical protein
LFPTGTAQPVGLRMPEDSSTHHEKCQRITNRNRLSVYCARSPRRVLIWVGPAAAAMRLRSSYFLFCCYSSVFIFLPSLSLTLSLVFLYQNHPPLLPSTLSSCSFVFASAPFLPAWYHKNWTCFKLEVTNKLLAPTYESGDTLQTVMVSFRCYDDKSAFNFV